MRMNLRDCAIASWQSHAARKSCRSFIILDRVLEWTVYCKVCCPGEKHWPHRESFHAPNMHSRGMCLAGMSNTTQTLDPPRKPSCVLQKQQTEYLKPFCALRGNLCRQGLPRGRRSRQLPDQTEVALVDVDSEYSRGYVEYRRRHQAVDGIVDLIELLLSV